MRRAARIMAGVLGLLALLLAGAAFLAGTAPGFRWLTEAAPRLSGGRLQFEGVDGHLGAPLGIRRLTITTDTKRIEIADLRLDWQPRALWRGRLDVDLLAAQALRVSVLKPEPAPPEMPRSLRLPLDVHVRTVDLARLEIVGTGGTLTFRRLRGRLDDDGDRYRLSRAGVATPWADLDGQLELGKDAPFALRGEVDVARDEPVPLAARLGLTGSLAALRFRFDARGGRMRLTASGEAAPFAALRLPRLLVAGEGIDPRLFVADAPAADLAFSGVFEERAGGQLLGTFAVANTLAGTFDRNRLPLARLAGAVYGDIRQAEFRALEIDLGVAGKLSGSGLWREGRFSLGLASPSLDLAGLHRDLYATRMRTTLQLAGDAARQSLDGEVSEVWGRGRFRFTHGNATLRLESANFSGQSGRLAATGVLRLDASRAFAAEFDAAQINPARFGKFPRARLNARGQLSGALAPEPRLQARFTLPSGELEGRPVTGQGWLRYESRHLADADVDINLAGNLARLKGAYGRSGDRLAWDIDAPALGRLHSGLAGRLTSSGSASGDPARPQVDAQLAASGLRLPGELAAAALNLRLKLQAAADGAFEGRLDARGVRVAGRHLHEVRADLQGRRDAHTLMLAARLPEWQATASLAGGLGPDWVWRGQLSRAEVEGAWPMRLDAPAQLELGRARQVASDLALTLAGGQVRVAQFERQGTQMATRGSLAGLPLAPVLNWLAPSPPFGTDLRIDGEWNLRAGEMLDGTLRVRRVSGDVHVTDPVLDLGLTTLTFDLDAVSSRIDARLAVDTREAGTLRATGQAALTRDGVAFTLPRAAPLAWSARLDVPDLRLLRPLFPPGVRADARLDAQLAGGGSLAAPRAEGRVAAEAIRFAMPEAGVAITDGTLTLALDGERVRVEEGVLKGSSGRVVVSGEAQLRNPQAGLALAFERFAVTKRSDREVIVSGLTRLSLDAARLQLTGALAADRARLEMPEAGRPELSDDVVVVGRPPREAPAAQRLPLALDMKLDLGNDFRFKGAGLDIRLGGALRVFTLEQARADPARRESQADKPAQVLRGEGTIRVEEGRYTAYAQALDIERGALRFTGAIDNPGLDVLAVRKTATVTAGVQVGGTMRDPQVKLYSDPPMPDKEKLSWLVFGHAPEEVSNDLESTVVSVGARLSSRATLSYAQSLDGLNQVVKMLYQLTPRVQLEAQTGGQTSLDVIYTREYD